MSLIKLIKSYYFYDFSAEFDIFQSQILFQNIANSEIAIISKYLINRKNTFFIISFHNTVIVVKKALLGLLAPLLCSNLALKLYFLHDTEDILNQQMQTTNYSNEIQIKCDDSINDEIENFNGKMHISNITNFKSNEMYQDIQLSITRYLIQESYNILNKEQIVDFTKDFVIKPSEEKKMNIEKWDPDEFIELKNLGSGSSSEVKLMFQIEDKKLYAIKMQNDIKNESEDYPTREYENYLQLSYPLLPKLYGIYKFEDRYYLKIQYINGKLLENIERNELSFDDKIFIISQLMLIINYFYEKGFVYRDLKPNNVIVDENKTVFIIDLDRMISEKTGIVNEQERTKDFNHIYVAPEVNKGQITHKSDIYSLGKMIEYIWNTNPVSNTFLNHYVNENPSERLSICDMLYDFNLTLTSQINNLMVIHTPEFQYYQSLIHIKKDMELTIYYLALAANQNYPQAQFNFGLLYYKGQYIEQDISKAIHYLTLAANQNIPQAQYYIGLIYYEGQYIAQDINKAVHYLTLAAEQNIIQAQYMIGLIYYEDQYITRDINMSIHYLALAADNDHPQAQFKLGFIYYTGQYITRDINKAIHYLALASNQNDLQAQCILGSIYYEGQYITRDINKAIHYFTLAANHNHPNVQCMLGLIYYDGQYIKTDINKAIHYLTLAANQNYSKAQYVLGLIYYKGQYITRDINKSIHYYTLAANQNYPEAQYNLGVIYYEDQFINRDINKSIHYFTLAANQNYSKAQFMIGLIYYDGRYITRDINKSIQYYTLAANQNYSEAQFNLGLIYYTGQYITRDINKSIYYLTLAANQNIPQAQFKLSVIYDEGKYIARDINKSIHYLTLAANQNITHAQIRLGLIYYEGQFITRNINKAIHYFTLASNQNFPESQYILGIIYCEGQYITRDINKAIQYLTLASNQNHSKAQCKLGLIYYEGQYITKNINKAIHYFTLAANQNHSEAQYNLGLIYYSGQYIASDINKSNYYLTLAANNNYPHAQYILGIQNLKGININKGLNLLDKSSSAGDIQSNFAIGYLYHEGKYIERNMNKCIKHYKYASSFNDIYSKNNLGVIYKNGIGDEIPKNIGYAIEYFEETVRRWEDKLCMYNLAHIYIYEIKTDEKINESINLLIKSSNLNFEPSKCLLCIALINKHKFDLEKIRNELTEKSNILVMPIIKLILKLNLFKKSIFQLFERRFKAIDFLYNFLLYSVQSKDVLNQKNERNNNKLKNITHYFYDGFGNDI